MSLPKSPTNDPPLTREEAINQILSSIAMEELGLSHIINAEGEKIQFALGTIPDSPGLTEALTIKDLLALDKSARETLDGAMRSQMFLKAKMEGALDASVTQRPPGPAGPQGPPGPFLSSYIEALGDGQTIPRNAAVIFDVGSVDAEGGDVELGDDGKTFTIKRAGLYHAEWNVNLAPGDYSTPATLGVLENGAAASGAASSGPGGFSSGTLINVVSVPFTLELFNYGDEVTIERHAQFADSAASIRILRFADGPGA